MSFQPKALLFALGTAVAFIAAPAPSHAQIGVNIQLGHPTWGPAVPVGTQYYYVPEIDGYYDLATQQYIVLRNGQWVPVATVPGYNPASFHPVVVNYRGREPWAQYRDHHARYYRPVAVQQRPVVVRQRTVVRPRTVIVRNGHDDHGRDHRDDHGHGRR